MFRPDTIHLRRSDAETLERLIESTGVSRDAGTLALLDEELSRATIVADDALPADAVALDSQVTFCDLHSGEQREIMLVVPSKAASSHGRISVLSPVGSALIGLHVGDHIDWPMPGGRVRRLRVLAVSPVLEVA
ncbi:MAG TPA: nucleoside diphosphate kinase regulator [Polyangiales bacterium]|nr:nucleoside diphosphate kinase regulator [Polyangiales bacterium]